MNDKISPNSELYTSTTIPWSKSSLDRPNMHLITDEVLLNKYFKLYDNGAKNSYGINYINNLNANITINWIFNKDAAHPIENDPATINMVAVKYQQEGYVNYYYVDSYEYVVAESTRQTDKIIVYKTLKLNLIKDVYLSAGSRLQQKSNCILQRCHLERFIKSSDGKWLIIDNKQPIYINDLNGLENNVYGTQAINSSFTFADEEEYRYNYQGSKTSPKPDPIYFDGKFFYYAILRPTEGEFDPLGGDGIPPLASMPDYYFVAPIRKSYMKGAPTGSKLKDTPWANYLSSPLLVGVIALKTPLLLDDGDPDDKYENTIPSYNIDVAQGSSYTWYACVLISDYNSKLQRKQIDYTGTAFVFKPMPYDFIGHFLNIHYNYQNGIGGIAISSFVKEGTPWNYALEPKLYIAPFCELNFNDFEGMNVSIPNEYLLSNDYNGKDDIKMYFKEALSGIGVQTILQLYNYTLQTNKPNKYKWTIWTNIKTRFAVSDTKAETNFFQDRTNVFKNSLGWANYQAGQGQHPGGNPFQITGEIKNLFKNIFSGGSNQQPEQQLKAQIADLKNTPNALNNLLSTGLSEVSNLANTNDININLNLVQPSEAYKEQIAMHYHKNGTEVSNYYTNKPTPRSRFNFIRLNKLNDMFNTTLQEWEYDEINSLFTTGIRLWTDLDNFYNYDIENWESDLITTNQQIADELSTALKFYKYSKYCFLTDTSGKDYTGLEINDNIEALFNAGNYAMFKYYPKFKDVYDKYDLNYSDFTFKPASQFKGADLYCTTLVLYFKNVKVAATKTNDNFARVGWYNQND